MKLEPHAKFLTRGSVTVAGPYRAVALHPSSEVDLVDIGPYRLGVGDLVPLMPGTTADVRAVRRPTGANVFSIGSRPSRDGVEYPGEKLVLQLYEACDALVPPVAKRHPVSRSVAIPMAADTQAGVAAAVLAFRLPFQGRKHAVISFDSDDGTDFRVTIVGHRKGFVDQPLVQPITEDTNSPYTWFTGGVAPPLNVLGDYSSKTIHVGGHGDDLESFDELSVWIHNSNPVGSGSINVSGEADGER